MRNAWLLFMHSLILVSVAIAQGTGIQKVDPKSSAGTELGKDTTKVRSNGKIAEPTGKNERYEDRFPGATLALRITAAVTDCGSAECIVVIPANELGSVNTGYPVSIPDNALLWDQRSGGIGTFVANPKNCKNTAGFLNIQIGIPIPRGQIGGVSTQCVGAYIAVEPEPAMDGWGLNSVTTCQARRDCWGYEMDIRPVPGTGQAVGFDSVVAGSGQADNMPAFRCFTAFNTNPVGGWKNCMEIRGVTDTAFLFSSKDDPLQITQKILGSESPQTVTTSGNCTKVPFSQLYVGGLISVDSGSSQEDVLIMDTGCAQTTTVTGIFRKNHSNPIKLSEYGAQRIWDAQNYVASAQSPYIWGSIQKYNESSTPNSLGFGVIDSTGIARIAEFYTRNDAHVWRDLRAAGFIWQNEAGVQVASLGGNGMYTSTAYATLANCAVNTESPAPCGSAASGAIVVPGMVSTYTVNTTAVTPSSRVFLFPTTDPSNLPSSPNCVAPAPGAIVQISRAAGSSFTFSLPRTSGTVCLNYWIID